MEVPDEVSIDEQVRKATRDLLSRQLNMDERWLFEVLYYQTTLPHEFFQRVHQINGLDKGLITIMQKHRVQVEKTLSGAIEVWTRNAHGMVEGVFRREPWTLETESFYNGDTPPRWTARYTKILNSGPNSHFNE